MVSLLVCRMQPAAGRKRWFDHVLQPRVRRRHVVGGRSTVRVARSLVAAGDRLVAGAERRHHGPAAGQRAVGVVAGRQRARPRLAVA